MHDVLLVYRGITLVRCVALPVASCTKVSGGIGADVSGFGEDGRVVEFAGAADAPLVGPFVDTGS